MERDWSENETTRNENRTIMELQGTRVEREWNENGTRMERQGTRMELQGTKMGREWNEDGTRMERHGTRIEREWNVNSEKRKQFMSKQRSHDNTSNLTRSGGPSVALNAFRRSQRSA